MNRLYDSALLVVVIAVLFAGGCGLFGSGEAPSLRIETDRNLYHLARDSTIEVDIQNTSGKTIYYSTCLAMSLEVWEDGRVVDTIGLPVCYCSCPAKLEPGAKVASSVSRAFIEAIAQESDRLRDSHAASYRLRYAFWRDEAWGDELLPRQELRSNRFALQLP